VQAVGCDLTGLAAQFSDGKRVRNVYARYALYKSTPLSLPFYCDHACLLVRCQRTCLTNYDDQQTLKPDNDCFTSSMSLVVRRTRLTTVRDSVFPIASARLWNSLPSHVTAAPSLPTFRSRLKSYLFSLSYPIFFILLHLFSARTVTCPFGHYNRFYIHIYISFLGS